ncbi:MAG: hypothetical protein ABIF82_03590 [Planctomycetota bacterium]
MNEFNAFKPKDYADFVAFRADWHRRMIAITPKLLAAKGNMFPVVEFGERDLAYEAKVAAQAATTWDAALADNPILVPGRIETVERDPLEDFTTYIEVDPPAGEITVAVNTLTFTNMGDTVDRYVYKDFGAGHFGNHTWTYAGRVTAASAANIGSAGPSTATEIDDVYNNTDAAGGLLWWSTGSVLRVYIYHYKTATIQASDFYNGVINTWYYYTYTRTGSSVTCYIYSAPTRLPGDLLATLVMDDDGTARQYCFGVSDRYAGSGRTVTGAWADLDIGEAASVVPFRRRIEGY